MEKRDLLEKPPLAAAASSSSPNSNNSANTSSSSQSTFDPRTFDAAAAAGAAPHCATVDPALPRGPPAVDQVNKIRKCTNLPIQYLREASSYRVFPLIVEDQPRGHPKGAKGPEGCPRG